MEIRNLANWKLLILLFVTILIFFTFVNPTAAQENKVCVIYFTGVGCPHCARTDSVILIDLLKEYPNLIIIEYEIYRQEENGPLILEYNSKYGSGLGIPLIIFDKDKYFVGDIPILQNIKAKIKEGKNKCLLLEGSVDFNSLCITALPGKPKLWTRERILISIGKRGDDILLRDLLTSENLSSVLENVKFETIKPQEVVLSGREVQFDNAIKLDGWIFQWNREGMEKQGDSVTGNAINRTGTVYQIKIAIIFVALLAIVVMIFLKIKESRKKKENKIS